MPQKTQPGAPFRKSRGMGARVRRGRTTLRSQNGSPSEASQTGPGSRELAAAAALFFVATLVLSYPLALHPATSSRFDNGDARLNAWAISWVAHQILHDPLHLFDANTFYPLPHSLAYSEHLTVEGLIALPLLALTNDLTLTTNLVLLFAMFSSAFGMYLLAHTLTRDHLAALAAGLFFSFAPFRFNRLPHIQMQLYGFIPLFLAALHLYASHKRPRWIALCGLAFVLQALSGTYLGAIAAVALALSMVTLLPGAGLGRRELAHVFVTLLAVAAVLVPFALPYLWVHRELGVEWDLAGLESLSATPGAYLQSSTHLYRTLTEAATGGAENGYLFPGLTISALGALGLATLLRRRGRRHIALGYGAILIAGVVLSLGPRTPVYPFLYEHVVFFRGLRALTRFALLPLLSLSVFAGYGLSWLFQGLARRRAAFAAVSLFFAVESTSIPYGLTPHRDNPPEVYTWLKESKPGPIVELPFKVVDTRYMFWARHHGFRPMLNGDSGFIPMSHQWMKVALGRFPSPDAIALLRRLNVRYVVLHLGAFRKPALLRILRDIESHRDALLPARDFGESIVFEVLHQPRGADDPPEETMSPVPASASLPALTDGVVETTVASESAELPETPEMEVELTLSSPAKIEGLRLHYGAVPRTPVAGVTVLLADEEAGLRVHAETPPDWPAVTELVMGLIETPLDGTQMVWIEPVVTGRLRLRLRGIDGRSPELSEIEILARPAGDQRSRLNTGN